MVAELLSGRRNFQHSFERLQPRQRGEDRDNVKAAGITLYTVHVNTDGDPMSTLLKNCASTPGKSWMLTSASQMATTFQQIGTQLSNLRIAE